MIIIYFDIFTAFIHIIPSNELVAVSDKLKSTIMWNCFCLSCLRLTAHIWGQGGVTPVVGRAHALCYQIVIKLI